MKHTSILALIGSATILAGCAQWHEQMGGAQPIAFNQMPPAAQATVRNEIGNQPINRITQESKYGQTAYRVEVERKGPNPSLWVATDGSIIKESRRLVGSRNMYEAAGAENTRSQKSMDQNNSRSNY
jgi:hypothetical protein